MSRRRVPPVSVAIVPSPLTASTAPANCPTVLIPLHVDGAEYTVSADDVVVHTTWWGACSWGLANDKPVFHLTQESLKYRGDTRPSAGRDLSKCVSPVSSIWRTDYRYWMVDLEPGDLVVHFATATAYPTVDGGDWDGDGKADVYNNIARDNTLTIHVTGD